MVYDVYNGSGKTGVKGKLIAGIIALIVIIAAIITSNIYLEVIQLKEIGDLQSIYIKNITYKLLFSAASFIIIFSLLFVTTIFIKKNIKGYFAENNLEPKKLPNILIALVIAIIGAFLSKDFFYLKALSYLNSVSFGTADPLFNKDIGYYVFQRPFLMSLYEFISALWLFIIVYTVIYYVIVLLTVFTNGLTLKDLNIKTVIRHNLINLAIFFMIKAISYKFQKEGLLYSNVVNVKGASYVDVNVWMKYFEFIPFLLIAIVIAAFIFISLGKLKKAATAIAVYPAVWIVVTIVAVVMQQFIVKPYEPKYESQYLKYNMEKTREAYNIDKITNTPFQVKQDITPEYLKSVLDKNPETVSNIRVVDYQATLDSDIQLQSNTNFYNFHNGDIINYNINGKEIPVFITAREIDKSKLQDKSPINTLFKYTHGYGIVINPINKLTSEGQVDFILKDVKLDSQDKNLKITQPRIYYGELTNDHVIVNPAGAETLKEIDYDGNEETSYTGKSGIQLGLMNKLLFALKFADFNMVISGNVSADSKLLLNREILNRAQKAVPFLTIDTDPYILPTSDGKLKWVVDAYTSTDYYPYAQDIAGVNYIRNSVKIVIDAYDGDVSYYIIDEKDPIILAYKAIYPGIFKSKSEMPIDILNHMKYPEYLFKIQTEILKRYHLNPNDATTGVQNINTFYTNTDTWNIAKYSQHIDFGVTKTVETSDNSDIPPYYNMIKLPSGIGKKEELVLMRPFTPSGSKNNMVSWLAVRNSSEEYGQLILFNFPKNTNIWGPYQVDSSIGLIDKISKDITLWNDSGSTVFKGSLLVLPIEDIVLYVEPIYIKSGTSSIPQVREVVVGYQSGEEFKYGIGTSLKDAMDQLFISIKQTPTTGQTTISNTQTTPSTTEKTNEKLVNDIQDKYDALKKQIDELGKLLSDLKK